MRKKTNYFLTGIAFVACALSAYAQTSVATIPEGMISFNVPGGETTYLSFPLSNNLTYTGAVSAVTSTTISVDDSPAPWNAGALASAAAPYFVKFLSGNETGRILLITANTSSTLTLDVTDHSPQTVYLTASGFSVSAGDTFEIFPADTLASVFGDNSAQNPLVFQGSTSVFSADCVSTYNPTLMCWQAYYFNTTAGYWQLVGATGNANNTILYPFGAVAITRPFGETTTTFALTGRVTEVSPLIKTPGGSTTVFGSTGCASDMTLSQLQLGSNWTKGTSPITADTLSVWNPTLCCFDCYYQTPDSTWHNCSNSTTDQSNFVLAAGTAVSIVQHASVAGENSFLSTAMPYSLE
jgi:uncharacterized protein (TIGR02597 family)